MSVYVLSEKTAERVMAATDAVLGEPVNEMPGRYNAPPVQPPNVQLVKVINLVRDGYLYRGRIRRLVSTAPLEYADLEGIREVWLAPANLGEVLTTDTYLAEFKGFHTDGRAVFVAQRTGGGTGPTPTADELLTEGYLSDIRDFGSGTLPAVATAREGQDVLRFAGTSGVQLSPRREEPIVPPATSPVIVRDVYLLSASAVQTGVVTCDITGGNQTMGDGNKHFQRRVVVNTRRVPLTPGGPFGTEDEIVFRVHAQLPNHGLIQCWSPYTAGGPPEAERWRFNKIGLNWPDSSSSPTGAVNFPANAPPEQIVTLGGIFNGNGGIAMYTWPPPTAISARSTVVRARYGYQDPIDPEIETYSQGVRIDASRGLFGDPGYFETTLFVGPRVYTPGAIYAESGYYFGLDGVRGQTMDVTIGGVTLRFIDGGFVGVV